MSVMVDMKISICVPVYGVEKFIGRCVISLLEQSYSNIEYIFVNDCTPDKSIQILERLVEKYPNRDGSVTIINHKENRGLAAARNTAVENCTGEFVLWVDSDDYIDKDTVKLLVEKQLVTGSDIISFDFCVYRSSYKEYWIQPEYSDPEDMTVAILARKAAVCVTGRLIRTSLYKTHNIKVVEGVNMSEDYQIAPQLAYYAQKVSTLNKVLYHYDCTNENAYTYTFSEQKARQIWQTIDILKNFFSDKDTKFSDALKQAELEIIVRELIDCSKFKGHIEYFNETKAKLKSIEKRYWRTLGLPKRIVLYLRNIRILRSYVKIAGVVKHGL